MRWNGMAALAALAFAFACDGKKPGDVDCAKNSCAQCEAGTQDCPCTTGDLCIADLTCTNGKCLPPCPGGQVLDGDSCRPPEGCEICTIAHRACVDEPTSTCGDCLEGYALEGTVCTAKATCNIGAPGSIADDCAVLSRQCVETADGASCGGCIAGTVEVSGSCSGVVTCEELDCASALRHCADSPNAHCTICLDGYVEDAGTCRATRTCEDNPCAGDEICTASTATRDRICSPAVNGCPEWSVPHQNGLTCVPCAPCDTLESSTGEMEPQPFGGIECVCEAAEGYMLVPGYQGGATQLVPCDEDGDGWTRDTILSLRDYQGSTQIIANNHCAVQTIIAVEFQDEYGQVVSTDVVGSSVLPIPVPMLESLRNDSDSTLLGLLPSSPNYLPSLGGRKLTAQEINGLTKYCVSERADFNDNGVPDLQERHEDNTAAYLAPLNARSEVAAALRNYTYYGEVYSSTFVAEPAGSCAWSTGIGGSAVCGRLVIRERSRSPQPGAQESSVSLTVYDSPSQELETPSDGSTGNNYWRSCTRFVDATYQEALSQPTPPPLYGLDFARLGLTADEIGVDVYGGPPRPTLGHHSQFKCVAYDDTPAAGADYVWQSDNLDGWTLNECSANQEVGVGVALSCEKGSNTPPDGWVGWAVSDFLPEGGQDGAYQHGCVDEFYRFRAGCPGFSEETANTVKGDGDVGNFGKLLCGCGPAYGGDTCWIGCPQDYLHIGVGSLYPLTSRPYWMCGEFGGTTHPAGGYLGSKGAGEYSVSGSLGGIEGDVVSGTVHGRTLEIRHGFVVDYVESLRR